MEYLNEDKQKKASLGNSISNAIDYAFGLRHASIPEEKTAAKSSDPLSKPSETWDLSEGIVESYQVNEQETLYLFYNRRDRQVREVKGVLRHEVKNIPKSAERLAEILQRVFPTSSYSIDQVANELTESTDKGWARESDSRDLAMRFDYTEHELTYQQKCLVEELGGRDPEDFKEKCKNYIPKLYIGAGILTLAGCSIVGGIYSRLAAGVILGVMGAGMSMLTTAIGGGLASLYLAYHFDKTSIVDNLGKKLKSKIRKQLKIANKLKEKYATAGTFNGSIKVSEKIEEQNQKLGTYWGALCDIVTRKCASITCSQKYEIGSKTCASEEDAKNKVLEFFREKLMLEKKGIIPEKIIDASKQELSSLKTLDKIIVEPNWIKDDQHGREIDGRYVLKERIGEGGLCRVYRAVRKLDDREVAIKFEKPEARALKEKEELIKILKTVRHENLIETHDANLQANPAYIVMDLIEGADLGRILDFARATKQYLSLENIMSIAKQTGEALKALHSNGTHKKVVHNDIKPQNILIDKNGKTYLGDCDVADIAKDISSMLSQATAEKASGAGTLEYMSPERRSAKKTKIDERSDIYSFGVVLYELIAGQVPMTPDGLDKRTDLPEELKKIVCKCVSINPENRYDSMAEVMAELNKLQIKSKPAKLITNYEIKEETPKPEAEQQPVEDRQVIYKVLEDRLDTQLKELNEHVIQANKQLEEVRQGTYGQRKQAVQEPRSEDTSLAEKEPVNVPEPAFVKEPIAETAIESKQEPVKETAPELAKETKPEYVQEPAAETAVGPEPELDEEEEPEEKRMYE